MKPIETVLGHNNVDCQFMKCALDDGILQQRGQIVRISQECVEQIRFTLDARFGRKKCLDENFASNTDRQAQMIEHFGQRLGRTITRVGNRSNNVTTNAFSILNC